MKLGSSATQSETLKENLRDRNLAYWAAKLKGINPIELNQSFAPSIQQKSAADMPEDEVQVYKFSIRKQTCQRLSLLSESEQTSLSAVWLAAFKIILFRLTNQADISIAATLNQLSTGATKANRSTTLAFRSHLNSDIQFVDFVKIIEQTIAEGLVHQPVSLKEILTEVGCKDKTSLGIVFSAVNKNEFQNPQSSSIERSSHDADSDFDLSLKIITSDNSAQGIVTFKTALYTEKNIRAISDCYLTLLDAISTSPTQAIGRLDILPKSELQFLEKFNDTLHDYSSTKTIVELFEEQVLKAPANTALIRNKLTLTYSQLNEKANRLARYLIKQGVKAGSNVGLLVGRDFDMIIGMYAILKTGSAYVPIDYEYPADRQKYILTQSSASHVITDADYPELDLLSDLKIIRLNQINLKIIMNLLSGF